MGNNLFDYDSEVKLLSILMKEPERIYHATTVLRGDMLSSSPNEVIYNVMTELSNSGIAPSYHVVVAQLENKNLLKEAGGRDYLKMVGEADLKSDAFEVYLENVVNSYKARKLLELSNNLPGIVEASSDISGLISNIKTRLEQLDTSGGRGGVFTIGDLMSNVWQELVDRFKSPGIRGISTGFPQLDATTGGFVGGQEWIICGRPSHGKSTALLTIAEHLAENEVPTLIFSKEMRYQEICERLVSMRTGIQHQKIETGNLTSDEKKEVKSGLEELSKLPILLDTDFYAGIHYLTGVVRKYHKLKGIQVVGIDYIQLMTERSTEQTAELGRISRELKLLAHDLDITVIALSQLNRLVEHREDKRPILSDLRQSGNLEEDADIVVSVYRDERYNIDPKNEGSIELNVLKHRNGPVGNHFLKFDKDIVKILDPKSKEYSFE